MFDICLESIQRALGNYSSRAYFKGFSLRSKQRKFSFKVTAPP